MSYSPILNLEGSIDKIMWVVEDITKLEQLEREVIESEEKAQLKVKRLQGIVSNNFFQRYVCLKDTFFSWE